MTAINKSASKIGTLRFFMTGQTATVWIGVNSNTGETIVWYAWESLRPRRFTGRNIGKLADELDFILNEGRAEWTGPRNDAALDRLGEFRS